MKSLPRTLKWFGAILAVLALAVACVVGFLELTAPPHMSRTLTVDRARYLVSTNPAESLDLWRLSSLTPEVAAVLAEHKGSQIVFHALRTLSPQAAELAKLKEGTSLEFGQLEMLSDEAAAALAQCQAQGAQLYLPKVRTLSPRAAEALGQLQGAGFLSLEGLASLPDEAVAEGLAEHGGSLFLTGLTTLAPEAAAILATFGGNWSISPPTSSQTHAHEIGVPSTAPLVASDVLDRPLRDRNVLKCSRLGRGRTPRP